LSNIARNCSSYTHSNTFVLGKHFEVAILFRVHQGHHRHTAQCHPGGGEALRLERLEARGEAKVRQELALEGVAHGGEPVLVAQPQALSTYCSLTEFFS
jgi:hypothetical protein